MKKKRGFTLIELVIVVAIIGILALLVIPQFSSVVKESKLAKFKYNCKVVNSVIATYMSKELGSLPTLSALSESIDGGWESLNNGDPDAVYEYNVEKNPVFRAELKDDEGNTYTYTIDPAGRVTKTTIDADGRETTDGKW